MVRLSRFGRMPRMLVLALVAALSFAAGAAVVAYGANPVTFSACLSSWGALSNVAIGSRPLKPCPNGQQTIS